ncbi:hypothetical protein GCM10023116_29770 [Kistimonas scapharcae]|uniref:Toxin-antitoxin system HicB family antitoxin n=1 Tax=Kistimonas scapharcae TaxID=1036133 RepID=A0ABP8V3W6_9GAMM
MAVGNSGRLVIELDPELKLQIRRALKERGLTMKEWLLVQVHKDLINSKNIADGKRSAL